MERRGQDRPVFGIMRIEYSEVRAAVTGLQKRSRGYTMKLAALTFKAAFLAGTCAVTLGMAAELGVYFDGAASVNCLPEVTTFPYVAQAYIIATNCAGFGGVRGWEAALTWDNTLIVSASNVSGQAINVRAFPEYMVGLAAALPDSDTVVLAQLNVLALGPGGIFVHGLGVSVPDSMPAFVFEGSDEVSVADYLFGSPVDAVASVGILPCPAPPEPEGTAMQEMPPFSVSRTLEMQPDPMSMSAKSAASFEGGGYGTEVGFLGTVLGVSEKCLEYTRDDIVGASPGHPIGTLEVVMEVSEWYWGASVDTAVVYVMGYDVDNCVRYLQEWPVPERDQVQVNSTFFVAAHAIVGGYLVTFAGTMQQVGPGKNDVAKSSLARFKQYSEREQMGASSAVIDARFVARDNRGWHFVVERVIKGNVDRQVFIAGDDDGLSEAYLGNVGSLVRLYLVENGGRTTLTFGRYSAQRIAERSK